VFCTDSDLQVFINTSKSTGFVIVLSTNASYAASAVYVEGLQPLECCDIAGSNPVEGVDVHPLCLLCVV
jgi:hypothetical protein